MKVFDLRKNVCENNVITIFPEDEEFLDEEDCFTITDSSYEYPRICIGEYFLDQNDVRKLIPYLENFIKTGKLI